MKINWDKVDPSGKHRDAVHEAIGPLLDKIAEVHGISNDDLGVPMIVWQIIKVE